jgi:hypothetical protein
VFEDFISKLLGFYQPQYLNECFNFLKKTLGEYHPELSLTEEKKITKPHIPKTNHFLMLSTVKIKWMDLPIEKVQIPPLKETERFANLRLTAFKEQPVDLSIGDLTHMGLTHKTIGMGSRIYQLVLNFRNNISAIVELVKGDEIKQLISVISNLFDPEKITTEYERFRNQVKTIIL